MTIFLTVLHVMVCVILVVVVLLQRGRGADIGAVFGGGASTTVFGSRGAGNFLTKLTTAAAVTFMCTSLTLAYYAREGVGSSVFQEDAPIEAPATTGEDGADEPATTGGFEEVGVPVEPSPAPAEGEAEPVPETDAAPAPEAPSDTGTAPQDEGTP